MADVVGVYARLSKLKGRDESIETQIELDRKLASDKFPGCTIREYKDPDVSAEREDVYREDYERLKSDILDGHVTQVCASDQERLTRNPAELERLMTVFRTAGIPGIWGYRDGWTSFVMGQSAGARYKGVGHKEYVEGIRVKVWERHDTLFSKGRPHGGRSTGYRIGRTKDKELTLDLVREEADHVFWGGHAVLNGWGLLAIGREWVHREMPRARGGKKPWPSASVKRVLTSPTVAGYRVSRRDGVERTVRGNWRPILATMIYECPEGCEQRVGFTDEIPTTCETHGLPMAENKELLDDSLWVAVCDEIKSREKATGSDGRSYPIRRGRTNTRVRKYLLTGGFALCGNVLDEEAAAKLKRAPGECGAPLIATMKRFPRWRNGEPMLYYYCYAGKPGDAGAACQRIGILGEPFEDYVERTVLGELDTPAFRAMLEAGDAHAGRRLEIGAELRDITRREKSLGQKWASKAIPEAGWEAAQAELDSQRTALTVEMEGLPVALPALDPDAVVDAWPLATLEEKRHILGMYVEAVVVKPGRPGKRITDDELARRIEIRWRY